MKSLLIVCVLLTTSVFGQDMDGHKECDLNHHLEKVSGRQIASIDPSTTPSLLKIRMTEKVTGYLAMHDDNGGLIYADRLKDQDLASVNVNNIAEGTYTMTLSSLYGSDQFRVHIRK